MRIPIYGCILFKNVSAKKTEICMDVTRLSKRKRNWKRTEKQKKKRSFAGKKKAKNKCASPESNRGPNDGNVGFYH